jgi:3-oxoadipate enol-lactonase
MARITVQPGLSLNCEIDDYLWPWMHSTPVLMQHGFSRNATFWKPWVPYVAMTRRVYRPEIRGCGQSDAPPRGFHLNSEILLQDVLRTLDTLGLERVHWVGQHSGGVLGVLFAAAHPERVASLVLIETPVLVKNFITKFELGQPSIAEAMLKFGIAEWCRRTLPTRIDPKRAPQELQDFIVADMAKVPDYVAAMIHDAYEPSDTSSLLKNLTMPVLLMSGDDQPLKPACVEHQRLMEREIPNARFKLFEGYGPGIGEHEAELCVREAIAFWESIDPSSKNS